MLNLLLKDIKVLGINRPIFSDTPPPEPHDAIIELYYGSDDEPLYYGSQNTTIFLES
jgi:hypothetical protein